MKPLFPFMLVVPLIGISGCASLMDNLAPVQSPRSEPVRVPIQDNQRRTVGYATRNPQGDIVLRDQVLRPRGQLREERDGSITVRDARNRRQATLGPPDGTGLRTVRDRDGRLQGYTRSRDGQTQLLDRSLRPRGQAGIDLEH